MNRPPGSSTRGPGNDSPAGRPSAVIVDHAGDSGRELAAWGEAVLHLHAAGLPAAVPAFPAAWLRRRGIRADWVSAA